MNYYFPYNMMGYPLLNAAPRAAGAGLFSRIFRNGINWGGILNGTQRTLSIINQTIPTIRQISPIVKNAKTMFKVMNEFKKVDSPSTSKQTTNDNSINKSNNISDNTEIGTNAQLASYEDGPTFFA